MSPRVLSRVILGLAAALLIIGAIIGFTPVDIPTGVTSTASCGSPWSPTTPEQCTAKIFPLALVATTLAGLGLLALLFWITAHWLIANLTADKHNDAGRINLGPRRNPKRHND